MPLTASEPAKVQSLLPTATQRTAPYQSRAAAKEIICTRWLLKSRRLPALGPLAPAVSLRVLNLGKDCYFSFFSFFAATHFLTQARMPGTLPAHLASQAASDPCFPLGPAIAGVSDVSTTIPQTINARMCFLSNLKRYLSRLRPSNQCPTASRLDELSLARTDAGPKSQQHREQVVGTYHKGYGAFFC